MLTIDWNEMEKLIAGYKKYGMYPSSIEVANTYWHTCVSKDVRIDILGTSAYNKHTMQKSKEIVEWISEQIILKGVLNV